MELRHHFGTRVTGPLAGCVLLLALLVAAPAGSAAAKTVSESAPATAECTYPLAVDCPRDNQPPIAFATIPEGVSHVQVTYKSTEYCAPMLLIIYDNGKQAGETSVVGGDTTVGSGYPNEGSTSFSLNRNEDHELAYRGRVTAFGCGAGHHEGETLSLHLFTGEVIASFEPPDERATIKGTVRIENDKGIPAKATGVPGAKVQISGPGGKKTVKVSPTGTYSASFRKGGTYNVFPRVPDKVTRGMRNPVKPEFRDVKVKAGETATANFTVKDPLRIEIDLARKTVPANGAETVKATITATENGEPVKGQHISIRPFDAAVLPIYQVPVPATICLASHGGDRLWPAPAARAGAETGSVDAVTDRKGEIELRISTGTIPGDFRLEAWAADSKGKLDSEHNILDVSPEEHLRVNPLGGGAAFETELTGLAKRDQDLSLPANAERLARQLGDLTAKGKLSGYDYAPVKSTGGGYEAVVVYPAGGRIPIEADGTVAASSPGQVLGGARLTTRARSGLGALPTVADWIAGKSTDFPGATAPIKRGSDAYNYFGYAYPSQGNCS